MALSYFGVITKGPERDDLMRWLRGTGRDHFVSPTIGGVTTFIDAETRGGEMIFRRFERPELYSRGETDWEPLVSGISKEFACIAWAVTVYDGDLLYYQLYERGCLIDEFVSDLYPYGEHVSQYTHATLLLASDHAAKLCAAFDAGSVQQEVQRLLEQNEAQIGPQDQHTALVTALGLPLYARNTGSGISDREWTATRSTSPA